MLIFSNSGYNRKLKIDTVPYERLIARSAILAAYVKLSSNHKEFYYWHAEEQERNAAWYTLACITRLVRHHRNKLKEVVYINKADILAREMMRILYENWHISNQVSILSKFTIDLIMAALERESNISAIITLDHGNVSIHFVEFEWFEKPKSALLKCEIKKGDNGMYDWGMVTEWGNLDSNTHERFIND